MLSLVRRTVRFATRSYRSAIVSLVIAFISLSATRTLFASPAPRPAGDLVKVAGVARSFEPLIYFSEHAVAQVHDLQSTSVAVWDLGESIRVSSVKDADSIVQDLDDLSDNLKKLANEMTKFFASVDGDIDGYVPLHSPSQPI